MNNELYNISEINSIDEVYNTNLNLNMDLIPIDYFQNKCFDSCCNENYTIKDFKILYDKKISIKGTQFDASNLPKLLNSKSKSNQFLNINKEIEIDLANIIAPLSENLKNFKLLGKIEKGRPKYFS